jgi:protein O-GlcNAc transferase
MLGVVAAQMGNPQAGIDLIRQSLQIDPNQPGAYSSLGNALRNLNQPAEALINYDRALELDPQLSTALNNRGSALLDLQRPEEALASYDRALQFKRDNVGALYNRGNALLQLRRWDEALGSYERALQLSPNFVPALCGRANALLCSQRAPEALSGFDHALRVAPDYSGALLGRAKALRELRRFDAALETLERCLAVDPRSAEAHHNRATVLLELQRLEEAVVSYDRVLQLDPTSAETHYGRGIALAELGRHETAATSFARAVELVPNFPYALGGWVQLKLLLCDWTEWAGNVDQIAASVQQGDRAIIPFALLAFCDSTAAQLQCARVYVADSFPPAAPPIWTERRRGAGPIRVAYLSADFRDHPVTQLLAGVLERLDRERFETIAVALRPLDGSALGQRVKAAAGKFLDVGRESDAAVAQLMRTMQVDVAVDLQGFTLGTRAGIFAHRAAPIQVNYLGFPATMGAEYIDYIIADSVVIPAEAEGGYAEHIVRLPDCCLPYDNQQLIAADTPSRAEAGLPPAGFVFCAFNNQYKITPAMFDVWMRLLRETPKSVLWLRAAGPTVIANLRREAAARGVAAERLVFAPRVAAMEDHLARHRLADLFLDTSPYNAHATAINALWAGLPVLTCQGTTFAGRVGASLLRAAGLPELISGNLQEYEQLALTLANSPRRLADIHAKLADSRLTQPLFETDRFCRHLEAAFAGMLERHRRGEAPADIAIRAVD